MAAKTPRVKVSTRSCTRRIGCRGERATLCRATLNEAGEREPEFTIFNFPSFRADPERDGTRSPTFILMDFSQRLVLIGGTSHADGTR